MNQKHEAEYLRLLEEAVSSSWDKEGNHINADKLVAIFIENMGYQEFADKYRECCRGFWYA